jgi:hypothetical protein
VLFAVTRPSSEASSAEPMEPTRYAVGDGWSPTADDALYRRLPRRVSPATVPSRGGGAATRVCVVMIGLGPFLPVLAVLGYLADRPLHARTIQRVPASAVRNVRSGAGHDFQCLRSHAR